MKRTWLGVIFIAAAFIGEALCAAGAGQDLVSLAGPGNDLAITPVSGPVDVSAAKRFLNGIMDGFAVGLNYPWLNYGWDFGDTAWGHRGISTPESRATVAADFARMRSKGAKVVRWFVMSDGRAAPEFDSRGMVTGFDNFFYADMDAALEIAAANGIKLVLVLFDLKLLDAANVVNGVQTGGRDGLIRSPEATRSLFDLALIPLFKRYGASPTILAWEIINESEWRISRNDVSFSQMYGFARQVAGLVHTHTSQMVTLGSAKSTMVAQWKGAGLDFYQYHYYDNMGTLFVPFNIRYSDMGLDKPCVLGEFSTTSSRSVETHLNTMLNNGFAGAWAWSYRAGDGRSDFNSVADRFGAWANAHR
jgi:hypothetical protein